MKKQLVMYKYIKTISDKKKKQEFQDFQIFYNEKISHQYYWP